MTTVKDPIDDPTPEAIGQLEATDPLHIPPLPVTVVDPAPVRQMPSRQAGFRRYTLTLGAAPVRILDNDQRRKRAILTVFDTAGASDGAILGPTQAVAGSAYGFLLALPGPNIASGNVVSNTLEITSSDEVWASASVATCEISVLNEQWAY